MAFVKIKESSKEFYLKLERVAEVDFRKVTSVALELEIEYQVNLTFLIIIDDAKEDGFCLASLREFSNIMHSKKELIDWVTMLPSKIVLSLNVTKFGSKQGSTLLSMRQCKVQEYFGGLNWQQDQKLLYYLDQAFTQ